jgi:16S rRNA U516 pseudouridylate synthase RsuA-like enzyme
MQFLTTSLEPICRRIALSGMMSRREAEKAVKAGLVVVDGKVITGPSQKVPDSSQVLVNGTPIPAPSGLPSLWALIKPRKYICEFTQRSSAGLFLPDLLHRWDKRNRKDLGPRGVSELDSGTMSNRHLVVVNKIPTSATGLVLLSTDGHFARILKSPESKILTSFRIRTGNLTDSQIDELKSWKTGIKAADIDYGPVFVDVEKRTPTQTWLKVRLLFDGKKNLDELFYFRAGIRVNRINCFAFGPYTAGDVPENQLLQLPIHPAIAHLVPKREVKQVLVHSPQ